MLVAEMARRKPHSCLELGVRSRRSTEAGKSPPGGTWEGGKGGTREGVVGEIIKWQEVCGPSQVLSPLS